LPSCTCWSTSGAENNNGNNNGNSNNQRSNSDSAYLTEVATATPDQMWSRLQPRYDSDRDRDNQFEPSRMEVVQSAKGGTLTGRTGGSETGADLCTIVERGRGR
jgi:hypothetical protein